MPALSEWDPKRGRQGGTWRRLVKLVCQPGSVCAICKGAKGPIIFGLRRNHPLGPSVDHIVPLSKGGHPTAIWNLQPSHFGCNAAKGKGKKAPVYRPSRAFPRVELRA